MPLIYQERTGDLFSVEEDVSLAHCVSQDMSMSKGIATLFRDKFRKINELKEQSKKLTFDLILNRFFVLQMPQLVVVLI